MINKFGYSIQKMQHRIKSIPNLRFIENILIIIIEAFRIPPPYSFLMYLVYFFIYIFLSLFFICCCYDRLMLVILRTDFSIDAVSFGLMCLANLKTVFSLSLDGHPFRRLQRNQEVYENLNI